MDVFISYRRANGSQLASLLKVLLTIRNLSVFLDVDRLEAGKFDNNLLQSIRSARNFVLVLTPQALDRCKGDEEQKDWIHKEIGMLGTVFDEILTSIYLEIAFILGLQTLQSIDLGRIYCLKGQEPKNKGYFQIDGC